MASRILAAVLFVLVAAPSAHAAELVMFWQKGCVWCERFDREIAPAYEKTDEGKRAPLRRVDIGKPMPADLAFVRRERFTPVFVLVDSGREFGRIRGYPGDTFFWGLLAGMIEKLDRGESAAPEPLAAPPPGATFAE
jgi:thioredoxin-related protein